MPGAVNWAIGTTAVAAGMKTLGHQSSLLGYQGRPCRSLCENTIRAAESGAASPRSALPDRTPMRLISAQGARSAATASLGPRRLSPADPKG